MLGEEGGRKKMDFSFALPDPDLLQGEFKAKNYQSILGREMQDHW